MNQQAKAISNRVERPKAFLWLARTYLRRQLRRHFDAIRVQGLEEATRRVQQEPVVFAANHTTWWDTFIVLFFDALMDSNAHCLMDARNFKKLPFFRHIGALPIDLSTPEGRRAGLATAAPYVTQPGDAFWIFPQGRQRPSHLRPLDLKNGVVNIATQANAPVIPVSIALLYANAPRPELLIRFSPAIEAEDLALPAVESAIIEGLDAADRWIDRREGSWTSLMGATSSRPDRGIGSAILSWWNRTPKSRR